MVKNPYDPRSQILFRILPPKNALYNTLLLYYYWKKKLGKKHETIRASVYNDERLASAWLYKMIRTIIGT